MSIKTRGSVSSAAADLNFDAKYGSTNSTKEYEGHNVVSLCIVRLTNCQKNTGAQSPRRNTKDTTSCSLYPDSYRDFVSVVLQKIREQKSLRQINVKHYFLISYLKNSLLNDGQLHKKRFNV
jgi:hypothetical protein